MPPWHVRGARLRDDGDPLCQRQCRFGDAGKRGLKGGEELPWAVGFGDGPRKADWPHPLSGARGSAMATIGIAPRLPRVRISCAATKGSMSAIAKSIATRSTTGSRLRSASPASTEWAASARHPNCSASMTSTAAVAGLPSIAATTGWRPSYVRSPRVASPGICARFLGQSGQVSGGLLKNRLTVAPCSYPRSSISSFPSSG